MREADTVRVVIDGAVRSVPRDASVAAAVLDAGVTGFRAPAGGGPLRAPICGMGICFECRVTIDGVPHQRACRVTCREGMEVRTGG